jgi:hypothetical protein
VAGPRESGARSACSPGCAAEFRCSGIKRRRPSRRRPARSGTPYGRAAWAPVPTAAPVGRPAVLRPPPLTLYSAVATPVPPQRQGAEPPADSLWSPFGSPTAIDRQPRSRHHKGLLLHASGGGTLTRGSLRPVRIGGSGHRLRWKPGDPLRRRPRTSRADQALPAKVVRPWGAPPSPVGPGPLPAGWDDDGGDHQAGRRVRDRRDRSLGDSRNNLSRRQRCPRGQTR